MNDEWLQDPYIIKWLSNIEDSTKKGYIKRFRYWLDFIQMSPTEQIEKRVKDIQSNDPRIRSFFEDKVIEYKGMLEAKEYSVNTIKGFLLVPMSFFSRNRLRLNFARGELKPESKKKVVHKWLPANEEIRALYSMADVRDRALLLVLYQSGFSEADVEALNIEDLVCRRTNKSIYEIEDHLVIFKKREKSDVTQKTCISVEAVHDIKTMLRERDNPRNGALFVTSRDNRLSTRFINEAMKGLATKALTPKQAKDFQTKVLRDCYGDCLLRANLTQQVKDSLFGHKPASARASYEISPQTVYDAYSKAFEYLSINGGLQTRKDLEDMRNTVRVLSQQMNDVQNATAVIMKYLKEKYNIDLNAVRQERIITDKEAEDEVQH